ncbi:hypothetical protein OG568_40900 [Streptomyces sp. NBC_01450]|uniref:hypothetical protein n=1 Tax=Streptomyces sp. NBC_01450 TaxID=2903871 RepID=UPI002E33BE51|nr:hypothetical protein [Streptomyces sp. NBC_01450]
MAWGSGRLDRGARVPGRGVMPPPEATTGGPGGAVGFGTRRGRWRGGRPAAAGAGHPAIPGRRARGRRDRPCRDRRVPPPLRGEPRFLAGPTRPLVDPARAARAARRVRRDVPAREAHTLA